MKVLFHTYLAREFSEHVAEFAQAFPEHEIVVANTSDELRAAITDAEVLVDYHVTPELLDRAPKLRWMFIPFTGVDKTPWELLTSRGIRVSNNHGNASIVAERAVALALALTGRVVEFDRGLRRGAWFRNMERNQPFEYWTSMFRQPVAILGTGAIGVRIAELLAPFTRSVVGFRRRSGNPAPEWFPRITTDLAEALSGARVCFITLALTRETDALIGESELELLKGAYLVNVSRGRIVDEGPLYRALSEGILAGAALDVWHRYPESFSENLLPSEYPFHTLENVVVSPHAGSSTREGKLGQLEGTLANLKALFQTGTPVDIADPASGY